MKSSKVLASIRKYTAPALTAIVGTALSIVAMNFVQGAIESEFRNEFDKSVSSVLTRTQTGFAKQEQVVKNLDQLFKANVQVVRDVFELYSAIPAKSDPGILSIGYANHIARNQVSELELYNRSEGNYTYRIFPKTTSENLAPISYIVPQRVNDHISGLDLESNDVLKKAIRLSARQKGVTVTPQFSFRGGDTMSLFLISPVGKKGTQSSHLGDIAMVRPGEKFDGLLFVELNAQTFLHSCIGDTVGSDRNIAFQITTPDYNNNSQVVFRSANFESTAGNAKADYVVDKTFSIGDRTFTAAVRSVPTTNAGVKKQAGLATLIVGLVLTLVLCGFLLSMLTSRERAENLARRMTASNRRILEVSRDIIATMDFNGVWTSVNPAIELVLGYTIREFEAMHLRSFMRLPLEADKFVAEFGQYATEKALDMEVDMISRNGEIRCISWRFTIEPSEGVVYCNGRDVTDARAAEEQIRLKSRQLEIAEQHAQEAKEYQTKFIFQITERVRGYLRNSVNSIHEMVEGLDPNNAVHKNLISRVGQASSLLFDNVSYLIEVARSTNTRAEDVKTSVKLCLERSQNRLRSSGVALDSVNSTSLLDDEMVAVDGELLTRAFNLVFEAIAEGTEHMSIEVTSQVNSLERVLEVQMLSSANALTERMIEQFNNSGSNIIRDLVKDENNIMFRLAVAASLFRRMNGTVSFASLGSDGNLVMLTLPQQTPYETVEASTTTVSIPSL
ncbi:MAG: CHASE domain-containing protein [Candidatus Kapaibacterium sp.]|jgi:PAS domain S-box-containing protein